MPSLPNSFRRSWLGGILVMSMFVLARHRSGAVSTFAALLALFSMSGCAATTAKLPPRNLAAVQQVHRVAIGEFKGPSELAETAATKLAERLRTGGSLQVIEVPAVPQFMGDGSKTMAMPVRLQQARMLGADSVINGSVKVTVDNKCIGGSISIGDPTVYVTFEAELIDAVTGQSILKRECRRSYTGEFDSNLKSSNSLRSVLARLTTETVEDVGGKIATRDGSTTVKLASAAWGAGASEIDLGNEAAERGDWATASEHYRRALAEAPDSDAAMYNMGLACEATGDLAQATEWYVRAAGEKSNDMYDDAAERTRDAERESLVALTRAERWRQQMVGQPPGGFPQQSLAGAPPGMPVAGPGIASFQQPAFGLPAPATAQLRRLPAIW